jgi:hypothetical protein
MELMKTGIDDCYRLQLAMNLAQRVLRHEEVVRRVHARQRIDLAYEST